MSEHDEATYAVRIKPLSVNDAWQGRRFKTPEYRSYEKALMLMLPKIEVPEGPLELEMRVGYSNKASDIDNFVKPFVDVMQKKYGFNDNRIYRLVIEKSVMLKGAEFVSFRFRAMEQP